MQFLKHFDNMEILMVTNKLSLVKNLGRVITNQFNNNRQTHTHNKLLYLHDLWLLRGQLQYLSPFTTVVEICKSLYVKTSNKELACSSPF